MTIKFPTFNRLARASYCCSALLAAGITTLAAQTTPAPAPAAPAPAQAAPASAPAAAPVAAPGLTVKVKGIRNAKGKIDIVIYGDEKGFPLDPASAVAVKQVDVDPQTMTATVAFDKLPPGTYAATVMHDENMVGKMEFDSQGIPLEGYGISNNPDSSSGPPTWDAAKFTVPPAGSAIEIAVIYWQ